MSSQQAQSNPEMPIAEVVRLINLVNYQQGAVVSRTLIRRTAAVGAVLMFANRPYSNGTWKEFVELLWARRVKYVIDVRSICRS